MSEVTYTYYNSNAYRADAIPGMPAQPKKRERIGEELLPFGDYADIDPYQQLCEDMEFVQHQDRQDKSFFETNEWWWDHQRIRFLNDNLGVSVFLLAMPYFIFTVFGVLLMYVSTELTFYLDSVVGVLSIFLGLLFFVAGFIFLIVTIPYINQFSMNFVALATTPLHKYFSQQGQRYMESRQSDLNRQTGMVSFAQGKKKSPFVAPFVEFDGYVERVIQRGGIFYRLMFVHRYTGKQFNQTSLSTIVDHKHEVHALWDMLQRYMDVNQPMPDVPRLEPFRHLDPTTAEHDQKTGRDPRYWRDLDLEAWKKGDGAAHLKSQIEYPWSRQRCQLTPQLGKVEMAAYKEQQQA